MNATSWIWITAGVGMIALFGAAAWVVWRSPTERAEDRSAARRAAALQRLGLTAPGGPPPLRRDPGAAPAPVTDLPPEPGSLRRGRHALAPGHPAYSDEPVFGPRVTHEPE